MNKRDGETRLLIGVLVFKSEVVKRSDLAFSSTLLPGYQIAGFTHFERPEETILATNQAMLPTQLAYLTPT